MVARCTSVNNSDHSNLSGTDIFLWRVLIWVMGLATPLLVSLQPRRFIVGEVDAAEMAGGMGRLAGQALAISFLIFACIVIFRHFSAGVKSIREVQGRAFFFFTMLLVTMPAISTLLAGDTLSRTGIVGTVILFSATYFLPTPPLDWWIKEVRVMLLVIFIYGSLVAGIFFPSWAYNLDYAAESNTAIIPLRLFGTTEHANALAPLAIFIWILGRFPNCRLSREYLHDLAILVVLLLTQSKTNWLICLALLGIYLLQRVSRMARKKKYLLYLAFATTIVCLYVTQHSHFASFIEDSLNDPQILTLTGRLPLWMFAVELWMERPWFGQGLDAWSSKAVLDYIGLLGWGATHAHNQVLQILSQSGVVGLALFATWCKYFKKVAYNTPTNVRVPFRWLILFFFLPGMTEVILQFGLGKASAIRTWIIFALVLFLLRSLLPQTSPGPRAPNLQL